MLRYGLVLMLMLTVCAKATAALSVLTYHDILADPSEDSYAMSRSAFVAHMDYLESNGYRVLSLKEVETYYLQKREFPNKSILLTFDDGLRSYAKFVVPVLRTYGFPSVASVVTGWLDGKQVPQEYKNKLMSWSELKQLATDPLVDIVTHTNNLHHGEPSNPQGNEAAAAVTRRYIAAENRYETEAQFRERVQSDLKHSAKRLQEQLGITVKGVTWPYGEYDQVLSQEASSLGLNLQLNLEQGINTVANLPTLKRIMLVDNPSVPDLQAELEYRYPQSERSGLAYLQLDDFAGQSMEQQEELLSRLLDVLEQGRIHTVIINPLHTTKSTAFFANSQLSTEADVLNRITHQIRHRLGIRDILIDLPELAKATANPEAVVQDLARLVWFNGVLLREHDKALVTSLYNTMLRFRPGLRLGLPKLATDGVAAQFVMQFAEDRDKNMQSTANRINNLPVSAYFVYPLRGEVTDPAAAIERLRALGITKVGIGAGVRDYIQYKQKQLAKQASSAMAAVTSGERL